MKIQLGWEHSTKFLHTRMPTKRDLKELPVIELTSRSPYDPLSPLASQKTRQMVTHRNRAFQWSRPGNVEFEWNDALLAEWTQ